jgi:hypothetical protein
VSGYQSTKHLDAFALQRIVDFRNGNRKDAVQEILVLPTQEAVYVAALVVDGLDGVEQRSFLALLRIRIDGA